MTKKFDNIINEYIVGTQNTVPTTMVTVPPDEVTGFGHTRRHQKAIKRDKIKKRKYEKQIPRTLK